MPYSAIKVSSRVAVNAGMIYNRMFLRPVNRYYASANILGDVKSPQSTPIDKMQSDKRYSAPNPSPIPESLLNTNEYVMIHLINYYIITFDVAITICIKIMV